MSAISDVEFFYSALKGDSQHKVGRARQRLPGPLSIEAEALGWQRPLHPGSCISLLSPEIPAEHLNLNLLKKHILVLLKLPLKVGRACKMLGLAKVVTWSSSCGFVLEAGREWLVLNHDLSNALEVNPGFPSPFSGSGSSFLCLKNKL